MKNIVIKIPLIITIIIFLSFLYFLFQDKDPSVPQSALLNKKVPEFQSTDLFNDKIKFDQKHFMDRKFRTIRFF